MPRHRPYPAAEHRCLDSFAERRPSKHADHRDCSAPADFHPGSSGAGISATCGRDSRRDESETSSCWTGVGSSTVVLASPSNVANNVWADCGNLGDRHRCPGGLRFGDQTTCGSCSGTLIAPNMVATAGRCGRDASDCSGTTVVFGATSDTMTPGAAIPADTVYSCKPGRAVRADLHPGLRRLRAGPSCPGDGTDASHGRNRPDREPG